MLKSILFLLYFVAFGSTVLSAGETFLLIDGLTNKKITAVGSDIENRISPCSTFKIPLALMGYDAGILHDEITPSWSFQEGYDDYLEAWQAPITPKSWIQYSCVWYSKVLSIKIGIEKMQSYLAAMRYGNQDLSNQLIEPGLMNPSWINSSLLISPKEQVTFIQKMILGTLTISPNAIQTTKMLLFKEDLPQGWKLFGKTGWSGSYIGKDGKMIEHGWFVGWIEKDDRFFPFAYLIRDEKIALDQRIPRVKELLKTAIFGINSPHSEA